jgi:quinol-cytochrome oxidoreductase complex cytochrome b subunit
MPASFFHHLHPPTVPARQARFRYTLGAGGISVFLILVLLLTGILEMFYYIPTPEGAALSVQSLTYLVPYGGFIRNLHYWAAQLLVVTASIHLLRVIFTGAYNRPRRLNYLLGLALLVLVLFLDFSGYILRWDQGIHWALVAGTNLIKTIPLLGGSLYSLVMGGSGISEITLIRFYAWHIFGLTLILIGVGVWHVFRIRRDGGIAVPPPRIRVDGQRISRDELVRREIMVAILVSVGLILLASFYPAPISAPLDTTVGTTIDSRAPWFFLWIQQLLKWGDPLIFGILIPVALVMMLALIPFILPVREPSEMGYWFPSTARQAQILGIFSGLALLGLTILALVGL